jgi:hypothetical protein
MASATTTAVIFKTTDIQWAVRAGAELPWAKEALTVSSSSVPPNAR